MRGSGALARLLAGLAALAAITASAQGATPAAIPIGAMVRWDTVHGPDPTTFVSGDVTVTLASRPGAGGVAAVITVTADGRSFSLAGDAGATTAYANAGVGRLDAGARGLQVLFADFTGGAHCCDHVRVLEQTAAGWKVVDVATVDGEALAAFPKDLDGDGVADIVLPDDRFAYAFTFYAGSYMPPRIYDVVNGAAVDVSADPKYAPLFRQDMVKAETYCRQHANGACAAFAADAARLGRLDRAWPILLASWDRTTHWAWPVHCRVQAPPDNCPAADQQTFTDMPDALRAFLRDTGYLPQR
jgi:hypothetical protein